MPGCRLPRFIRALASGARRRLENAVCVPAVGSPGGLTHGRSLCAEDEPKHGSNCRAGKKPPVINGIERPGCGFVFRGNARRYLR